METLNVVLEKIYNRNEKSGESMFVVRKGASPIFCIGIIQSYPNQIPLEIKGEYKKIEGKDTFVVESCHVNANTESELRKFLSSGEYKGIGTAISNIVVNTHGKTLFQKLRVSSAEQLSREIGTNEDVIYRMLLQLKAIMDFEDVYDYIKSLGCDYFSASLIYQKFGRDCVEKVKNNPYILMYSDASFSECEKIAKDAKISVCDKRRLKALVEYIMEQNRKNGNTRFELLGILDAVKRLEKKVALYDTPSLFVAEELLSDRYCMEESGEEIFFYFKEDYDAETDIARSIKRISISSSALNNQTSVDEIEKKNKVTYGEDQKNAFKCLDKTGVKIITGGPGTGKTTLLSGILNKYEADNKNKEIVLCAPTGCAARKMQEHTGRVAMTVHKLLGICPYESKEEKAVVKKLTADCIVLDEASMADNELMARLLKATKNNVLFLILGDVDQIASVGPGNVFSDLIESGEIEVYRLNHIYRQGNKSLIIDNSKKVIKGDKNLSVSKNFIIKRFNDEKAIVDKIVSISKACEERHIDDIKVFTPSRNKKFATGSILLNKAMKKKNASEEIFFGSYSFCEGDKVLFNANNYDKGYFNGEEGVITSIQKHSGNTYVKVKTDDGSIFLQGTELEDIELAYAITAFKSQGGECKNAVIVIPKKPASLLKRQLLYVEITRAKENVMILSEKDALEDAISGKYEFKRSTGLIDKLKTA